MVDTKLIAVKLNVSENLEEVSPFLYACGAGYTTIFNTLPEPERYQQELEAVEHARDGGAISVLLRWPASGLDVAESFPVYHYAIFTTEQQAAKFAEESGADKVDIFNSSDDFHALNPIDNVIETLASWEHRPKGMDMSCERVLFVGRKFLMLPRNS